MLNSISNPKNSFLLLIALTVLFIFPAGSVYADWSKQAKLLAADGAANDQFGNSVSISGDYAIVGATYGNDSGSAYIFKRDGTNWSEQAKLTAADGSSGDYFGWSVSISGACAIVGAPGYDNSSGSAYIFNRSGTSWSRQAKLLASDTITADDHFGYSVSVSGACAIVGAPADRDNGADSGSAYIFKKSDTPGDPNWYEQDKLTAADGAVGDYFGYSVSISGACAIAGAYADDDNGTDSGSAYIFNRSGANWSEQAKLTASDGAASDYFGNSVSVSGDYAIVGAFIDDDNGSASGSAYMFKRSGTNWSEQAKLTASDGAAADWFGYSVSISGAYAIVGARYDDDNESASGSAYMFGKGLCPSSDLTGDCFVNIEDFAEMAGQWLQGVE